MVVLYLQPCWLIREEPIRTFSQGKASIRRNCLDTPGLFHLISSILLFLLASANTLAQARTGTYRFIDLPAEHTDVTCLLQDTTGFLWVGTRDGLIRYDGYNSRVFKRDATNPKSLANNHIRTLHQDSTGTLWVASGQSLQHFDPEGFLSCDTKVTPGLAQALGAVGAMVEDKAGILWIGNAKGLVQLKLDTGRWQLFPHGGDNTGDASQTNALLGDDQGRLWVGRNDGLFLFDTAEKTQRPISTIPNAKVYSLMQSQPDSIWVCQDKGFFQLAAAPAETSPSTPGERTATSSQVRVMLKADAGAIWLGMSQGLGTLAHSLDELGALDLPGSEIQCLLEDRSGGIWIGTTRSL